MNTLVAVAGVALLAAGLLFGLGHLLVRSLLRTLGWHSPFRLAVVLLLWFAASTLLVLPLFGMLLIPGVLAATRESWLFFAWVVGCFGASTTPFAVVVSRHMEKIRNAGKRAFAA